MLGTLEDERVRKGADYNSQSGGGTSKTGI